MNASTPTLPLHPEFGEKHRPVPVAPTSPSQVCITCPDFRLHLGDCKAQVQWQGILWGNSSVIPLNGMDGFLLNML